MRIAVIDLETDPFEYGRLVRPFVAGFYDGTRFITYWGSDCVARMVEFLHTETEPWTIYAHNGGRFDWFYFLDYIQHDLRIINGRIIQAHLGIHELRDSFAIMPFALEQYKKTPIDYEKFVEARRNTHKDEILSYLRDDCIDLHTLCVAFVAEFGNILTVGSAAMRELKKFHTFRSGTGVFDANFRRDFYFGGRNQVFKSGIIRGTINVYDVNSMYPAVMRDFLHPVSTGIYRSKQIEANTAFVSVTGRNYGAFPVRKDDGSLDFTAPSGTFHTTIHEFQAALDTKSFKVDKILGTMGFSERHSFDAFVNHFYDARLTAKAEGDKIKTLFYKFIMNSGYGKFAQNPENYCDWFIAKIGILPRDWHECVKSCDEVCKLRWSPSYMNGNYIIWEKPIERLRYFNIATGASITGAARSILLRGLAGAKNAIYCDTDSIICESLRGVPLDEDKLGAWKLEATGDVAAICGKKLYAIFKQGTGIKKAHKGARLTYEEILHIANGGEVEAFNSVPTFKWDGSHSFTHRRMRVTANV